MLRYGDAPIFIMYVLVTVDIIILSWLIDLRKGRSRNDWIYMLFVLAVYLLSCKYFSIFPTEYNNLFNKIK